MNLVNFVIFLCLPVLISTNKYNKEINNPSTNDDMPFRMKKMNLVWHKAQKRLGPSELSGIRTDLEAQDRLEIDLKRRKAEQTDDDGEFEAIVRRKFMGILKRYGLVGIVDEPYSNALPLDGASGPDPEKLDKKLNKIWKKAQMTGFSDEELRKLRVELGHQQEKMDEYNALRNDISQFAGAENSVHRFDDKEEHSSYKHKKVELKQKYKDMQDSYQYLESYLSQDPADGSDFKEPRVIDLWLLAKKANFTEVELQSFKEELHHFERKLEKKDFLQKELDVQSGKKALMEDSPAHGVDERHAHLQKKLSDYERKIKKTHTELKTRVAEAMKYRSDL